MIWGRLIGAGIGLFAGPFGVAFGFLVGLLVDQLLKTTKQRSRIERHLSHVGSVKVEPEPLVSLAGLCVAVSGADGVVTSRQVAISKDYLSRRFRISEKGRSRVARIIDQAVSLGSGRLDVAGLAAVVGGSSSIGEREESLRFLVEVAGAREAGLSPGQLKLLRRIGSGLGLSTERIERKLSTARVLDAEATRILGVSRHAGPEEVKRAYRALAAQFHPDGLTALSQEQQRESTEAFLRIRSAYEKLLSQLEREV